MRYFAQRQRRTNLPLQVTSFVGRSREIEVVDCLIHANRLVTIVGPAGAGKTRLALEVAERQVDTRSDGVWWVDLSRTTETHDVVVAVCESVGVARSVLASESAFVDTIRFRDLLLLVDNCEQVVESVATLLDETLRQCPNVTVLSTSREPLAIPAETTWRIPSLRLNPSDSDSEMCGAEALVLFEQRAAAVSEFQLTNANVDAVQSICERLDGLPLAIELAAAQMRYESPSELMIDLVECITSLRTPYRKSIERHRTLTAAIGWSYERLSRDEQSLFRQLSAFAAPIRATDVNAMNDSTFIGDEIVELLNALADKSLIERTLHVSEVTFRLLESVRLFATFELAKHPAELEVAKRLHAHHFAALACDAGRGEYGDDAAPSTMLATCYPNIERAIAWCIEHNPALAATALLNTAWWHSRVCNPATSWMGLAERLVAEADLDQQTLLSVSARRCLLEARLAPGACTRSSALEIIQSPFASERALADAHLALVAIAQMGLGDLRSCLRKAIDATTRAASWPDRDRVVANLKYGLCYIDQDFARARRYAAAQLQLAKSRGLESSQAMALSAMGDVARAAGNYVEALHCMQTAADITNRIGPDVARAFVLTNLAEVLMVTAPPEAAFEVAYEAAIAASEQDSFWDVLHSYLGVARCCALLGRADACADIYGLAKRRLPSGLQFYSSLDEYLVEIEACLAAAGLEPVDHFDLPDRRVLSDVAAEVLGEDFVRRYDRSDSDVSD